MGMRRFLRIYWIAYLISYLIAVAILLWLYWGSLLRGEDNRVFLLAAIFGVSAGSASVFAILVEGGIRAMLLIPAAVNKLLDRGRAEMDKRYEEAYRRFGIEVDGVVMLPRTPEVREFLDRDSEEPGKPSN